MSPLQLWIDTESNQYSPGTSAAYLLMCHSRPCFDRVLKALGSILLKLSIIIRSSVLPETLSIPSGAQSAIIHKVFVLFNLGQSLFKGILLPAVNKIYDGIEEI